MADPTPRWGAPRPTEADTVDPVRDIRALAIFTDIFAVDDQGTFALRPVSTVPAPGESGRYYKSTDTTQLYRDNGTGWDEIALLNNGKLTPTSSDAVANLYRSAAGVLKTDGTFQSVLDQVARVGATTQITSGAVSGNAGFLFGSASDANLYRSAASSLKTDGSFCGAGGFLIGTPIAGPAYQSQQVAANTVLRNKLLSADTVDTFHILGSGKQEWGPGGATPLDTNLYRSVAGWLKTDGILEVANLYSTTYVQANRPGGVAGANTATLGFTGVSAGPGLAFGSAFDTNLYRSAADTLKTDDSLIVAGSLTVAGGDVGQAAFSSYKTLYDRTTPNIGVLAAGTFGLDGVASGAVGADNSFYLDPSQYTVTGKTVKYTLQVVVITNATAPGVNFTFGLYPISGFGGAAGAPPTVSLGVVVAGSQVTFNTPGASNLSFNTIEFTAPASNLYALGVVTSGAMAANSRIAIRTTLKARVA